jgi:hypothetical protein
MSISTMVRHLTTWRMDAELPTDWSECLERTGGGFFHSPPGLLAGAPAGEPIYARYVRGGEVCGVALGVRTSCRLSGRPRHVYFPAWPVFRDEGYRRMAQTRMAAQLREQGIAEVRWDSFDEGSTPFSAIVPTRREYVVALKTVDDEAGMDSQQFRCANPHLILASQVQTRCSTKNLQARSRHKMTGKGYR